jgi:DNA-3-methyladenine glycosylase II
VGLTKERIHKAESGLADADPVMAKLISAHGPCTLGNSIRDPFANLAGSIIGQQLSVKAAATIHGRLLYKIGDRLTPATIAKTSEEEMRSAGLSRAKIAALKSLSHDLQTGNLSFAKLETLGDDEALDYLVKLKGVGPWTAEMFLIFSLGRPDVLSLGDAGLRRAAGLLYRNDPMHPAALKEQSEKWRPYRSIASWYLWASLDNAPG